MSHLPGVARLDVPRGSSSVRRPRHRPVLDLASASGGGCLELLGGRRLGREFGVPLAAAFGACGSSSCNWLPRLWASLLGLAAWQPFWRVSGRHRGARFRKFGSSSTACVAAAWVLAAGPVSPCGGVSGAWLRAFRALVSGGQLRGAVQWWRSLWGVAISTLRPHRPCVRV